ncbi:hypothetical protein ABDK56_05190 [Sphingomonas sp. ASV193]|uniref:hypothetical protein n=1 Tax=Sphingomonas sp. ASV193 TaxID=3144405 RepID=UPI0032E8B1D0
MLIALVAQQVANDWQWRQDVARTKAGLDAQITDSLAMVAERAAVEPCLTQRLADLAAKVAASDGRWKADPYVLPGEHSDAKIVHYAIAPAYRMPGRSYPDDVWQQAKAGGMLAHMTPADIVNYTSAFVEMEGLRTSTEVEHDLAPDLSFLSFDGTLDPTVRARALSTIAKLDAADRSTLNFARLLVEDARALRLRLSPTDEKTLNDNLDIQQKFRGACVDRAATTRLLAPLAQAAAR